MIFRLRFMRFAGEGRRTDVLTTPKKLAKPVAEVTPVKLEVFREPIAWHTTVDLEESPPFDEEAPKAAGEGISGDLMESEPISGDTAASVLLAPVAAAGESPGMVVLAFAETTVDAVGAASAMPADTVAPPSLVTSSFSGGPVGMAPALAFPPAADALGAAGSLPPAAAAPATPPSLASSSSSAGGPVSMALVPVVPAAEADTEFAPSARLAIGCRSRKVGICGVEFSRSATSTCRRCDTKIPDKVVRFVYWHTPGKPAGYIHTECIVRVLLPADELKANLRKLSPTEPSHRQAVVDALAALDARAF
jgi:predicted aconitase with swiveling domain